MFPHAACHVARHLEKGISHLPQKNTCREEVPASWLVSTCSEIIAYATSHSAANLYQ